MYRSATASQSSCSNFSGFSTCTRGLLDLFDVDWPISFLIVALSTGGPGIGGEAGGGRRGRESDGCGSAVSSSRFVKSASSLQINVSKQNRQITGLTKDQMETDLCVPCCMLIHLDASIDAGLVLAPSLVDTRKEGVQAVFV